MIMLTNQLINVMTLLILVGIFIEVVRLVQSYEERHAERLGIPV